MSTNTIRKFEKNTAFAFVGMIVSVVFFLPAFASSASAWAPEITVLGDNPYTITEGDVYTDPGATATDHEDGDLTSSIVVGGDTITTSTVPGTYTITYNVKDLDNNNAEEKTRSVIVNPKPVVTPTGTIKICVVTVDNEGNVLDTDTSARATFSLSGLLTTANPTFEIAPSTLPTSSFSTPLSLSEDVLTTHAGNDADCKTYSGLAFGSYYYGQEEIATSTDDIWGAPRYSDQYSETVENTSNFFPYSGELFTTSLDDDASRNTNADGHITLTSDRPCRTVVVLNTLVSEHATNTKPVITVLGDNPFTLIAGTNFTDPGATATDTEDGDVTAHIVRGGDIISTSTPIGAYTLTYNVTDSQGLAADQKTRTVNIIAATSTPVNQAPVITLTDGDMTITVGDPFTEPGYKAEDLEDGVITSSVVVGGDIVATTTPGTYVITYNVKDSKGLSAVEKKRTITVKDKTNGGGTTPKPQCSDGLDNDSDHKTDTDDPGCHSDGNPTNAATYTPDKNDETDAPAPAAPTNNGGGGGVIMGLLGVINGGVIATTSTTITTPTGGGECFYLREFIKRGANNNPEEVKKLQSFLRIFEGHTEVSVTGIYDDVSYDATVSFQEKYREDVLVPWGHTKGTGFVYLTTRKKVNEIYCNRAFPLNSDQQKEVDAFKAYLMSLSQNSAGGTVASGQPTPSYNGQDVNDVVGVSDQGKNSDHLALGGNSGEVKSTTTDENLLGTTTTKDEGTSDMKGRLRNLAAVVGGFFGGLFDSYWFVLLLILILILYFVLRSLYDEDDGGKGDDENDDNDGAETENTVPEANTVPEVAPSASPAETSPIIFPIAKEEQKSEEEVQTFSRPVPKKEDHRL